MIVDPQAMCRPLLDACPGSSVVTTCKDCGQRIDGLARIDERGSFVHPDSCPPPRLPEGQLL